MGEQDIGILTDINEKIKAFVKEHDLPFKFETDKGQYQTAIEFWEMGYFHPPQSKNWEESKVKGKEIKCPDLLDYQHKLIIEYEEEPKSSIVQVVQDFQLFLFHSCLASFLRFFLCALTRSKQFLQPV